MGLLLGVGVGSMAAAMEDGLSLPQHVDAPLALRLVEGDLAREAVDADDVIQVFVGASDECCEGRVPVAGRVGLEGDVLSFRPTFGFVAGVDYVARVRLASAEQRLVPFRIPCDAAPVEATVTDVFPSGDTLPQNVLRFYIHFSVPMAPHVAFEYVQLRDVSGEVDDAAFMQFKQELWSEDRTRLTVLIDPGRIKREVATNVERGPALQAGRRYSLAVVGGWPSADGTSAWPASRRRSRCRRH